GRVAGGVHRAAGFAAQEPGWRVPGCVLGDRGLACCRVGRVGEGGGPEKKRGEGAEDAGEGAGVRGCGAAAAVAGGAEGAEVGGMVDAAAGDGADVIDFEAGLVGGRAAGCAAVAVAREDEPAQSGADLAARGGGEEL